MDVSCPDSVVTEDDDLENVFETLAFVNQSLNVTIREVQTTSVWHAWYGKAQLSPIASSNLTMRRDRCSGIASTARRSRFNIV